MINFNEPPYMEKSIDYIRKAVENTLRSAMHG